MTVKSARRLRFDQNLWVGNVELGMWRGVFVWYGYMYGSVGGSGGSDCEREERMGVSVRYCFGWSYVRLGRSAQFQILQKLSKIVDSQW